MKGVPYMGKRPSVCRVIMNSCKSAVASIVLFVLYRAIKVLHDCDSRIRYEFASWPEGLILELAASANGPALFLKKSDGRLVRLRRKELKASTHTVKADISIVFKSVDAAFLVLTGQIGVAQAYAQHRFTLQGDIAMTMSFVRCVDIAEVYLFPSFMTRRILKRIPKKQTSSLGVYRRILFGV